jgi:hypothetical protein
VEIMPEAEFAGRRADMWLQDVDASGIIRLAEPGWHKLG